MFTGNMKIVKEHEKNNRQVYWSIIFLNVTNINLEVLWIIFGMVRDIIV